MHNLPRYRSHKIVQASQIKHMDYGLDYVILHLEHGQVDVPYEWIEKHSPFVGGYYVVYPDKYVSFSPKGAFESGYTKEA